MWNYLEVSPEESLEAGHKQLIISSYCRDLKPSNVLLDGNGRVRLSYFGVWEEVDRSVDPEAVTHFYCAPGMR